MIKPFLVYLTDGPDKGKILRTGYCAEALVPKQARAANEAALMGVADDVADRVFFPAEGEPYVIQGPVAEVKKFNDHFKNRVAPPDQVTIMREALRAKGIDLSQADLDAAIARLRRS